MIRTWKRLGLLCTLTAALLAAPVFAADPEKKSPEPRMDEFQSLAAGHIQKLHEDVAAIRKDMEGFNARLTATQNYIAEMRKQMEGLKDLDKLKDQLGRLKELDELKEQVAKIEKEMGMLAHLKDIDQLKDIMTAMRSDLDKIDGKRKALVDSSKPTNGSSKPANGSKPKNGTAAPAPEKSSTATTAPAGNSKIRFVNTYPGSVTILLSGDRYVRLEQGDTQTLEAQPAGPFTYEIVTPGGTRPPVSKTLEPYETFTITVYGGKITAPEKK